MGKSLYYLSRLSTLSFPEICYRLWWKARLETFGRRSIAKDAKTFAQHNDLQAFKIDLPSSAAFKKLFVVAKQLEKADRLAKGIVSVYDVKTNAKINWNKDYKTGKVWPKKFVGSLHHADPRYGFVRYVWELNRHHHFVTLGMAYYLTKKDSYLLALISQWESWFDQNPYAKTINWFSGLECAVRVINWWWTLSFVQGSIPSSLEKRILASLYEHYDHLRHNLSRYSSANNHLTGELAAIRILTTLFPSLPGAAHWKKMSTRMLLKETLHQILPDGTGAEQSTNYLLFVIELYIQAFFVLDKKLPRTLQKRLLASERFLLTLKAGAERLPQIGDSDDAHLLDLSEEGKSRDDAVLSLLAAVRGEKGIRNDAMTFWITQKRAFLIKRTPNPSTYFSYGGIFVSNAGDAHLVADCGPLGYLRSAGHGHADALSFLLSIKSLDIFVDPGTFTYHNNKVWRNYFRATASHNTLTVDQKNSSVIIGDFLWGKKAEVLVQEVSFGKKDVLVASHQAYGPVHKREIIHEKELHRIIIRDSLVGGHHHAAVHFHLHPAVTLRRQKNKLFLSRTNASVTLTLPKNTKISVVKGGGYVSGGWYAPSFGVKVPSYHISATAAFQGSLDLETVIRYGEKAPR